jgi:hypothetical protein
MKRSRSSILTLFIILMFNCNYIYAQKTNKIKTNSSDSTISKSTTEYTINGKTVSQEKFEKFFAGLKEIEGTWFCEETSTGGNTGYDATDKNGTVYEYVTKSDSGKSINSIRRKNDNILQ